jgi:ribosomal protein L21E
MNRFVEGDRVRVDIPDETDPDHDHYHGVHGTIVSVIEDDASTVTGDDREGRIFRVDLETGVVTDFRWRDLRPPVE